eukprot:SAG31_NODE_11022_length_1073_cov_1.407598_1_plen_277_part_01
MARARVDAFVAGLGAKIIAHFLDEQNVGRNRKMGRPRKVPHEQFVQTLRQALSQVNDLDLKEQLDGEIDSICGTLWKQYKHALKMAGRPKSSSAPGDASVSSTNTDTESHVNLLSERSYDETLLRASLTKDLSGYKELLSLPALDQEQCAKLAASLRRAKFDGATPFDLQTLARLAACGNALLTPSSSVWSLAAPVLSSVLSALRHQGAPAAEVAHDLFARVAAVAALCRHAADPDVSVRHTQTKTTRAACSSYLQICRDFGPDTRDDRHSSCDSIE